MAEPFKIQCDECSSEYIARVKGTKHCNVCRAVRDATYVGSKKRKCFACQAQFAPVNRKDELCSNCDYHHKMYGHGDCALCKAEDVDLMRPDIAVCIACMRDPAKRDVMLKALHVKKKQRMENPIRGLKVPVKKKPKPEPPVEI